MKKTMLIISISFIFILSFISRAYAPGPVDITYNNISKVYIEYENGQNQVFTINPPVSYTFHIDGNHLTDTTGTQQLLIRGELNQTSNISKIALWMESFNVSGDEPISVGGYYGLDRTNIPVWIKGYSEISSWYSGDLSSGTSGVVNFNQTIGSGPLYAVTNNSSFNPQDKKVIMKLKAYILFGGASTQTENL